MTIGRRSFLPIGVVLAVLVPAARAQQANGPAPGQSPASTNEWTSGPNIATPKGLPDIGKWMLTQEAVASDWLGEIFEGKNLREPINVIILDEGAASVEDARSRLIAASTSAGYPIRFGHSTGYQGYIGGELYPQLPQGRDDAFSNNLFELDNDHGRVFGPHKAGEAYVFTAAFSREDVSAFRAPGHRYASFNRARDSFTQSLDRTTRYKVKGFVELGNALIDDPRFTTGDHDGVAVLLHAEK